MSRYNVFNRQDKVAEGWYWLLPSKKLKKNKVKAVNIIGYELAVFRGNDGVVAALDAYCPHMGAHLAEGKVEGNQLRCFFHNWRFDAEGKCTDIPCLPSKLHSRVSTRVWHVCERYGLIWIWLGQDKPTDEVVIAPELADGAYDYVLGKGFTKGCHPNVVMINAIDEQHFQTVHSLPGSILYMQHHPRSTKVIEFENTGKVPKSHFFGRLISRFYKGALTYNLLYSHGNVGIVTLGPDFLHFCLMFALRLTLDGKTQGYTLAFTRSRKGLHGRIFNRIILWLTQLVGSYFAIGDTRIFQTIKFDFKTPIASDHAIIAFINHLEQQPTFPVHTKG